jgi:hypothetical protein
MRGCWDDEERSTKHVGRQVCTTFGVWSAWSLDKGWKKSKLELPTMKCRYQERAGEFLGKFLGLGSLLSHQTPALRQ